MLARKANIARTSESGPRGQRPFSSFSSTLGENILSQVLNENRLNFRTHLMSYLYEGLTAMLRLENALSSVRISPYQLEFHR
jgi:hypothetical protein